MRFVAFGRRFLRARDANIAIIAAITLLPMLLAVAGAIDFGVALLNKTAMQSTADAAALAGAKAANVYLTANGSGPAQVSQATALGNTTAQNFFNANNTFTGAGTRPTLSISTTIQNAAPTVVMSVSASYTPFLLQLAGITAIPLGAKSTTTMSPANSYYQIVFLVDVSGSMTIGGDASTIAALENTAIFSIQTVQGLPPQLGPPPLGTPVPCAFACHDPNNYEGYPANSTGTSASNYCNANPSDYFCKTRGVYYCPWGANSCPTVSSVSTTDKRALAKLYGYKLKIDYVNSAISSFMSQISMYNTKYPGRYTVGINTFGSTFNVLLPPTADMAAATTAAGTIDVEAVTPVAATNWGHTRTTLALTSTLANLTNVGDGSSPTKMQTFVIFLTDAAEDVEGNQIYNRQADVNYVSACTSLKRAGVDMFSIWAPYYAIPGDYQYNVLIAPLTSQMPSAMQSCASSANQYYQANDGPGITAAVNTTFNTILNNTALRLTH